MIAINKEEAAYLRKNKRDADVHMSSRTKKSRGKRYFMTESFKSLKLLNDYRNSQLVTSYDGR